MRSAICRWGNGPAVRLPAAAMERAGFGLDEAVVIRAGPGRVGIERVADPLDALIDQITPGNIQPELDWGPPRGREIW